MTDFIRGDIVKKHIKYMTSKSVWFRAKPNNLYRVQNDLQVDLWVDSMKYYHLEPFLSFKSSYFVLNYLGITLDLCIPYD